jgi:hypothetical protein
MADDVKQNTSEHWGFIMPSPGYKTLGATEATARGFEKFRQELERYLDGDRVYMTDVLKITLAEVSERAEEIAHKIRERKMASVS